MAHNNYLKSVKKDNLRISSIVAAGRELNELDQNFHGGMTSPFKRKFITRQNSKTKIDFRPKVGN
jgi:hypothetical protein